MEDLNKKFLPQMNSTKKDIFENYPIPKAVVKLALPTTIGMLVMVIYNLVDAYFIGLTNDAIQVAAVSYSMPVFLILIGCGNLFGAGASANISRALGEKSYNKVKLISSFAIWSAIILGVAVGLIGHIFMDTIIYAIGTDDASFDYVKGYLQWLTYGSVSIILSNTLGYLLRSEGNTKLAMVGMMLGTFINVVLDPILIFNFNYGVVGAAMATVIANSIVIVFFVFKISKLEDTFLSFKFSDYKFDATIARDILVIGIPSSLNNILISIATIVYNLYLTKYGTVPVAAMGIVIKLNMLCIMLFMGIGIGVQPLFGYTYGAKMLNRLKESVVFSVKVSIITGIVCFVGYFFAPETFISMFIDDAEVIEQGAKMLRAQVISAPILGLLFLTTYLMQVVNKPLLALLLSICRQGLTFIPSVMILDKIAGLDGLIYAQVIADSVSVMLSILFSISFFKNLNNTINENHDKGEILSDEVLSQTDLDLDPQLEN